MKMAVIDKSSRPAWIAACVAAGLFIFPPNGNTQDMGKKDKTEKMEKGERGTVTASLSGDKEVPPVQTKASGKSTIKVDKDKSLSGKVTVEGMTATAAHIQQGAADKDGPVIIPLEKTAEGSFSVPANKKLTDEQFAAFKEGNLYINVHSKQYPSGEIRAQMKP